MHRRPRLPGDQPELRTEGGARHPERRTHRVVCELEEPSSQVTGRESVSGLPPSSLASMPTLPRRKRRVGMSFAVRTRIAMEASG